MLNLKHISIPQRGLKRTYSELNKSPYPSYVLKFLSSQFDSNIPSGSIKRTTTLHDSQDPSFSRQSTETTITGETPHETLETTLLENTKTIDDECDTPSSYPNNIELAIKNAKISILLGSLQADPPKRSLRPIQHISGDSPFTPSSFLDMPSKAYSGIEFNNISYRPHMEDAAVQGIINTHYSSGHFFMVCDGHGIPSQTSPSPGKIVADYFSQTIPLEFERHLKETEGKVQLSLLRAFKSSNALAKEHCPEASPSGTTANMVYISKSSPQPEIHIANCGDSRALLCQGEHSYQLSDDHSIKNAKDKELHRISNSGGSIKNGHYVINTKVKGGIAMTRSLGNFDIAGTYSSERGHSGIISGTPDVFTMPLNPSPSKSKTRIILGCDGVFDVLSNDQIAKRIKDHRLTTATCAKRIIEDAIIAHSTDNISVIVIDPWALISK